MKHKKWKDLTRQEKEARVLYRRTLIARAKHERFMKKIGRNLVKTKDIIDFFNRRSDFYSKALTRLAIENFAIVEGSRKANDALKRHISESVEESSIGYNDTEISNIAITINRIEVFKLFLKQTELAKPTKERIFRRYIGRVLPLRDNVSLIQNQLDRKDP
jgi:hypothetical protein